MADELSKEDKDLRNYFRQQRERNQASQSNTYGSEISTPQRIETTIQIMEHLHCDYLGILTDQPTCRRFATLESRIGSLVNWPENKTHDKITLAEAGFAYTGVDDSVKCFYCSIGLRDWPEGACPWEQHILASPACGHVIHCKGKGYIRRIIGEHHEEVDDSAGVVDTVHLAMLRNEDAVIVAKEYCTNDDIIKKAINSLIRKDIQRHFSAAELVKSIQEIKEHYTKTNQIEQNLAVEEQNSIDTDEELSDSEEDMEEINRKLKDPVTCKICFDALACIITLPCTHMVCCSQCISALTKCAVCREQIQGTVRAIMAV